MKEHHLLEIKNKIDQLERENNKYQGAIETIKQELQELLDIKNKSIDQLLKAATDSINKLQKEIDELEKEQDKIQEEIDQFLEEHDINE